MSWQRVRGHDHWIEAFARVVERGRLAHAYLFAGPQGVGKRLFAEELAKTLLCESPRRQGFAPCDQCPSCHQVAAGTHPDFHVAGRPEESLELPIDTVREYCKNFGLKSARGRGKVAILDDADDMNLEAANCFLKTLEEPPPRSLLLLIGSSPERQLATILSRCQVVRFAPLPVSEVMELLLAHGIEDRAFAERLARLSGGSVGLALALADAEIWQFRRQMVASLARPRMDSVAFSKAWVHFVEEAGKEAALQRRRAALLLRLLIDLLASALSLCLGGTPRLVDPEDQPAVSALAARADPEKLAALIDRCLEADYQIERRVQLVLLEEALVDALGQQFR